MITSRAALLDLRMLATRACQPFQHRSPVSPAADAYEACKFAAKDRHSHLVVKDASSCRMGYATGCHARGDIMKLQQER